MKISHHWFCWIRVPLSLAIRQVSGAGVHPFGFGATVAGKTVTWIAFETSGGSSGT